MAFRISLIVLAGWLTIANAAAPTLAPRPIAQSSLDHPCAGNFTEDRKSELCAQWKAADAARDSARWAMIGTLVAMLGIFGLYWQVVLTRRAVEDTSDATKEMRRANEIAHASQRPWLAVSLELVGEAEFIESGLHFDGYIVVKNVGQSAALDVHIKLDTFNQLGPKEGGPQRFVEAGRESAEKNNLVGFVMAPNEETRHYRGFKLLRDKFAHVMQGTDIVLPLVMVSVTYRREGDPVARQTAKGFIIEQLSISNENAGQGFRVDGSNVPAKRLRIRHAAEGFAN